MTVTRTMNPIHFEDLDPKRFEDLVRNLIYDFRDWDKLEPTGRTGSDDGYDARGLEKLKDESQNGEGEEEEEISKKEPRLWLIQCKREKTISPKKLQEYLRAIPEKDNIYGVIFAAACDFSKTSRDLFTDELRKKGISESYLWGKADIEDMLLQPKNDHLLFGFFGISLSLRKRSLKSSLNSKLSIKRKLVRIFGNIQPARPVNEPILIRDVNDKEYPYWGDIKDFKEKPRWILRQLARFYFDGIEFVSKEFHAYVNQENNEWDFYEQDFSRGYHSNCHWANEPNRVKTAGNSIHDYWYFKIPEENHAYLRSYFRIPFDKIWLVDEMGDELTHDHSKAHPHIYVPFGEDGTFESGGDWIEPIGRYGRGRFLPDKKKRIQYFPKEIPEINQTEKDEFFKKNR